MRLLALIAIRGYQRYLSPRKGFHCAYCQQSGGMTCSNFGYRAIAQHGLLLGSLLLKRRLRRCRMAAEALTPPLRRAPLSQRGDCDPSCDGDFGLGHLGDCDPGSGRSGCKSFRLCSGCSDWDFGSCDWPDRSRSRRRRRQQSDLKLP